MTYRPDDWYNSFEFVVQGIVSRGGRIGSIETEHFERKSRAFEEGADAMLEALDRNGWVLCKLDEEVRILDPLLGIEGDA